jgi:microsomal dipeptidase-like Zn-dependent dipeptidase
MGLNNMLHFVYPSEDPDKKIFDLDDLPRPILPEGKPPFEGFLDHVRHVIDLVGPDHIGFGFDLCEFDKPEEKRNKSIFPSYRHVAPFIERLDRELPKDVAEKIRGGNWMRILETLH